jgi:hypothetical protein
LSNEFTPYIPVKELLLPTERLLPNTIDEFLVICFSDFLRSILSTALSSSAKLVFRLVALISISMGWVVGSRECCIKKASLGPEFEDPNPPTEICGPAAATYFRRRSARRFSRGEV